MAVIAGSLILVGGLTLWGNATSTATPELLIDAPPFEAPLTLEEQERSNPTNINYMNPVATVTTSKGEFQLELFTDLMPVTTGNFITLAEEGFYDGTKFHRVIDGFMIQGGDPNTKGSNESTWGTGGPGYAIADEHVADPKLSNLRGTISMANSGPNSGGSQFFVNVADNIFLDFDKDPLNSKHPVFGRVVSGMDVVDAIVSVDTKPGDVPVEPVEIVSVVISEATEEQPEG